MPGRKQAKTPTRPEGGPATRSGAPKAVSRAGKDQATIAELARILGSSLDMQEVYPLFAERAATLIPFDRITINLVEPEQDYFTALYEAGISVSGRQWGDHVPLTGSVTAAISASRKALLVQGGRPEEVADRFPGLLPEIGVGLRSFLSVPLVVRGEVIGGINLRARAPRAYTKRHVQLAETLAQQIAAAIANARLYAEQKEAREALARREEEARQLAEENAVIAEVGRIIGSTPRIEDVYARFSKKAGDLVPADRISVTLFDDDEGETHSIPYIYGLEIPGRGPRDRVPAAGTLTGDVARCRCARVLEMDDRQAVEASYPGLLPEWEAGIRSAMGIPLIAQDRVFGALHFRSRQSRAYSDRHLRVAQSIAHQIAGAISNARLFAAEQAAQSALRDSEERYRHLVHNAEFAIVVSSLASGKVLLANERATGLFGVPASQAVGLRVRDYWVHPERRDRFIGLLIQQGRVADYECELRDKHGAVAWVLLSANVIEYGGERAAFVVYNNITERKRAEQAILDHQRRLEALLQGSLELSRIQPVESLLGRIGETCTRLLKADGGDFRIVEGDELARVAAWGCLAEISSPPRLRIGEGLSGGMAARGEPLIVDDLLEGPGLQNQPETREAFRRFGLQTWLGVPSRLGDRLLATLNIVSRQPHAFSAEDTAVAGAFSAYAATALENARLFAESQRELRERQMAEEALSRRARQLEAVKAVGEEVAHELDVEVLLDLVTRRAMPLVGADVGTIFLWDEAAQLLRPRVWLGPAQPADDRPRRLGEGVTGAAAQLGSGLLVNDFPRSPYALDYILALGSVSAVLAQPFFSRGSLIGVFSFSKRGDPAAAFSPEDQTVLSLLAPQVAIAVENAHLYEAARRTAEALRESEESLRITLQSIGDAVIATDRSARIVQMNPVAEALTGWERGAAEGRHLDEVFRIVNARTREPLASPAARVLESGGKIGLANDTLLIARDGTERQIADSGAPIRDADEEMVGVVLVFRDVTAEYATREQLRRREEQFRTIFETSPFGIVITRERDGAFVKVNPSFERLSGYREAEVVGRTGFEVGLYVFDDEAMRHREMLAQGGRIENVETTCICKKGERHQVFFSAARMEFEGEPCVLSVTIDITETKRMEEQLRQSQKMEVIGQLAGGVAHDFNNMLSVIIGSAELLTASLPADSPAQGKIRTILDGTQRAADLTRKLLAFSRKGKVISTPLDIHEQITAAIALLERSIDRRIQILTRFEAANPVVVGDPSVLQNALLNLGVNARDAMPDGGTLSFTTANVTLTPEDLARHPFELAHDLEPGPFVEVCISDTGVGIPAEILPRIFEPFFTTKEIGKGTGLGLAAVFGTVREHRGSLLVESEPGRGTTFRIFLPTQDVALSAGPPPEESTVSGSGCVLLVDDEDLVRTSSQALLEALGYDVLPAEDGEEAVEVYRRERERVDVVLLDMVMPKLSGRETFERLREIDPAVRVIFCSGFSDDQRVSELLKLGASGFIQKPYPLAALSRTIADAMGRAGGQERRTPDVAHGEE